VKERERFIPRLCLPEGLEGEVYTLKRLPSLPRKRESCIKRPPSLPKKEGILHKEASQPPKVERYPGICLPTMVGSVHTPVYASLYIPGYTDHATRQHTGTRRTTGVRGVTALTRGVTELTVAVASLTVRYPFHCWLMLERRFP